MLIDTLFDWMFAAAAWLVGFLPEVTFSTDIFASLADYMGWVGYYVDAAAGATVVAIMITTEAAIAAVSALVWLYKRIPLAG